MCVCVIIGAAALTRQKVVLQDGLFDQVVRYQLCAVHQRVSRDVGQRPCAGVRGERGRERVGRVGMKWSWT